MSVSVSRGDGDTLEVSVDGASIIVSELRIRPMSNFKTPHQVLGKGGASIALTDEQMLVVVAEYVRYSIWNPVTVKMTHVGWKFVCEKTDQMTR